MFERRSKLILGNALEHIELCSVATQLSTSEPKLLSQSFYFNMFSYIYLMLIHFHTDSNVNMRCSVMTDVVTSNDTVISNFLLLLYVS